MAEDLSTSVLDDAVSLIVSGGVSLCDRADLEKALECAGWAFHEYDHAISILEMAERSGTFCEVLGVLHFASTRGERIARRFEQIFVSEKMWARIESMRAHAEVHHSVVEDLLAGLQSIDTRDWDDQTVEDIVEAVIRASKLNLTEAGSVAEDETNNSIYRLC